MKPQKNITPNSWTTEDERAHPESLFEWWAIEGLITSVEDKKQWSLKAVLSQGPLEETIGSICNIALLDEQTNQHYTYIMRYPHSQLKVRKEAFEATHDESTMKGAYPIYEIHLEDPQNDIQIDLTMHAESAPAWAAQEATNGWLPMGIGSFRYGFLPKTSLSGTMKIKGLSYTISGVGYLEHVFGDFSYRNPLSKGKDWKKTFSIYARLLTWWLQNQKPKLPSTLIWATENNPLGYDWVWAVLDNGWTFFYGNILCYLMQGPAAGVLILSKDGKTFTEFANISFRYLKTCDAKIYDFVYPTELEIVASHGGETLHLRLAMTTQCREYLSQFSSGRFWKGLIICESPGIVTGVYTNGDERKALSGRCKIEPQRQVSVLGHNSLRLDIIKPPQGVGFSVCLDSHYLGKKLNVSLGMLPKPYLRFICRKSFTEKRA